MRDQDFIMKIAKQKAEQLGYVYYNLKVRSHVVKPNSSLEIKAYNQIYYILSADPGIAVSSDCAEYDKNKTCQLLDENIEEHRGEIVVKNSTDETRNIEFLQVILQE
ncbi:MAG: hypothetical protein ACK40G_13930 [Cytophagaceae bacterium]